MSLASRTPSPAARDPLRAARRSVFEATFPRDCGSLPATSTERRDSRDSALDILIRDLCGFEIAVVLLLRARNRSKGNRFGSS